MSSPKHWIVKISLLCGALSGYARASNRHATEKKELNPWLMPSYVAISTSFLSLHLKKSIKEDPKALLELQKIPYPRTSIFLVCLFANAAVICVGNHIGRFTEQALR